MRLDQFSGIAAFLRVAEARSFTRAAADLGVAPASLSEAVKGLEERLGVRLLNRTTRSVGLTEAGAAYLERVRPAAEELQTASLALREARDHPAGTLRLNVPWVAGPLLIEPLMGPFLETYPDVRLDLTFDNRFVDIAAEEFDAGVRVGKRLERDMIGVRLGGPLRRAVLASPVYIERYGAPRRLADLAAHRCIAFRHSPARSIAPWRLIENGREVEFRPNARISANTPLLAVAAAAQGLGLTLVVEGLALPQLRSGALVRVLEPFCTAYDPLHIYYSSRRLVPPKLHAFVDFARNHAHLLPVWTNRCNVVERFGSDPTTVNDDG